MVYGKELCSQNKWDKASVSEMADKLDSRRDCNSNCRSMGRTLLAWVTSGTAILEWWQNIICV
jgi:hypothetical protein